jgi:hypothetical protein
MTSLVPYRAAQICEALFEHASRSPDEMVDHLA